MYEFKNIDTYSGGSTMENTLKERLDNLRQLANKLLQSLESHYKIADMLSINCDLAVYNEIMNIVKSIIKKIDTVESDQTIISINYINQFYQQFNALYNQLPYRTMEAQIMDQVNNNIISGVPKNIENSIDNLKKQHEQLEFNFNLFDKFGFFSDNIVIIGANGSGKTSLANLLKRYLGNNGIVISAQRILKIPTFNNIPNPSQTLNQLKQSQTQDKTAKSEQSYNILQNEFAIVLQHLLADNIAEEHMYVEKARECKSEGKEISEPPSTNLEKTIKIWDELICHRSIRVDDGINISIKTRKGNSYSAIQMSDGEKAVLYLIAQVLQAPQNGFIVIDEPEMYLHKSILYKLWDRLEKERKDCIFIYLTHDLDFAASRIAKKVWIKSFTPSNKFEIENVPPNEIPENLMMELLGSRKTILFCEGKRGGIDEEIYHILFPNFTIIPVESCTSVINYTKAYNKLPNTYAKALGIIDRDFRTQNEIESLMKNDIFVLEFAEIENLFLIEEFLRLFGEKLYIRDVEQTINNIKTKIINELNNQKEFQVSRYVVARINHHFSESHIEKANNIDEIKSKFNEFTGQINIEEMHGERKEYIEKIINNKEYIEIIKIFNNKGLRQKINEEFNINDFLDRAIRFLNDSDEAKCKLHATVFPRELRDKHDI